MHTPRNVFYHYRGSLFTSARPAGSCHHELTISRYPIFALVESSLSPRRGRRALILKTIFYSNEPTHACIDTYYSPFPSPSPSRPSSSLSLSFFFVLLPTVANGSIGENLTASREWNVLRESGGEQLVSGVHEN